MTCTVLSMIQDICFPLVEGVLNGFNGTVFAYGQTGCGKSYTMMGVDEPAANRWVLKTCGIWVNGVWCCGLTYEDVWEMG